MKKAIAVIVAVAAALAVLPAAAAPSPPPLTPVSQPRYGIGPRETALIDTAGGETYVRFWRPLVPAGTTVPVILTMTPYSVLGEPAGASGMRSFYVRSGYAYAIADVPGTGNSGGCWDYGGAREQGAARDTVEWLGTRAWSSGKVAMIGASYDGTIANAAAVAAPPHLATIIPQVAISDWYEYSYHDGVRYGATDPAQRRSLIANEQGADTPAAFDWGFGLAPALDRDSSLATRYASRLCPGLDKAFHTARAYSPDSDKDGFWAERDYRSRAAQVRVPVLVQGGWNDWNVKRSDSVRWFEALPLDDPATPAAEGAPFHMMVMGQNGHGEPGAATDWSTILHAWLDRWLLGHDTGIESQHPVVTQGTDGVVRAEAAWPPQGTAERRLHLAPGTLTEGPVAAAALSFVDDGATDEHRAAGASTQTSLWYESAPLAAPLRIAGLPRLELSLITDGLSTHLTPVLFDLGPSGDDAACSYPASEPMCMISRGFLNVRYRDGAGSPSEIVPGQPYAATVRFIDSDYVVPAGHRIGLAVMSSNAMWAFPDDQRARNTILHGGASTLVLPVAPA